MADRKEEKERSPGTTTIAPGVLVTIAQLTALGVDGVNRLALGPGGVNRLFRRNAGDGVEIEVKDNRVSVELYLILDRDMNVREVSRNVQVEVTRAIEEMVGMMVERIDVHISDIAYGDTEV